MAGAAKIVNLNHVDTWDQYFKKNRDRLKDHFANAKVQCDPDARYSPNNNLSKKVSIWQGDITKLEIDAIVNAANSSLMGGGGVDGAIHRAAGPELKNECKGLGGCEAGDAKITSGYKLPSKYVIHTVGPQGEKPGLLKSCYDTCLNILVNNNLRTVAFPCISTGIYVGSPKMPAGSRCYCTNKNMHLQHTLILLLLLEMNKDTLQMLQLSLLLKPFGVSWRRKEIQWTE
ncbi:macro domain-containing protein RSc0334-like isoform X2 [Schistocerca cancellata]|nr:macro domain-containing protein RSc0334-like isoform X2 [Schistocerca cancellata]XP_049783508.1 macro domain-containing protein RSc0334-like isoform X2 [Schistocerca cancellata]XP_049783516.1 macro domain-containing protein RSc0334-like isoform X2 [Schistocerca cancellata]XP_049783526.1 macro domain-containing protein RSc0334-like isoform X2 [Schistocerca cancellata]XP_049783534.1 macro domain-containing protein RSc0334-like isoform X2 [Schistocerca cancellata]XP_049783543.1 macro domain-co